MGAQGQGWALGLTKAHKSQVTFLEASAAFSWPSPSSRDSGAKGGGNEDPNGGQLQGLEAPRLSVTSKVFPGAGALPSQS